MIRAFAARAQEHRLAIFRRLVREGPSGLSVGQIAECLAVSLSTLSHHLAHLERAGLLHSWRVERRIFYAVSIEGTRRLVAYLIEDCCQGHPEICGYRRKGALGDDHDLSQSGLRDVEECPCDDQERR